MTMADVFCLDGVVTTGTTVVTRAMNGGVTLQSRTLPKRTLHILHQPYTYQQGTFPHKTIIVSALESTSVTMADVY